MASALLAMETFNARNASVVPELGDPVFQDCDIQMDIENSLVFNTGSHGHQAAQSFSAQDELPCAIVGPFNDMPAEELSVLATSFKIPLTVTRAFNLRAISDEFSPYSTQIYPDLTDSVQNLVDYLLLRERTDFIATVYTLTDTGTQRSEIISLALSETMIQHEMVAFVTPGQDSFQNSTRTVRTALERVKQLGFRTIVLAMEFSLQEIPLIADMAEELGLNNGDYMWILFGDADPGILYTNNTNINKLIRGSAWLGPVGLEQSPAVTAWHEQTSTMTDKVNAANPMEPGETGYFFAEPNFFQIYAPQFGDDFMFDAVMATAMGACLARRDGGNTTGPAHVEGIRSVDFQGASWQVKFGIGGGSVSQGARDSSTIVWGVYNLLPATTDEELVSTNVTETYLNGTWYPLEDFVYADGSTIPPKALRDLPEQNYLTGAIRGVGLALMGMVMLGAFATVIWVYLHREHRILRAAQPHFLYVIAFGSAVSVSTILVVSFDESYGWSEQQLSRACMAIPWLLSLGHIITYGALFSKLWRINKVLQFSRRKIDIKQVAWPFAALAFLTLVILSLWTALDSLSWTREELNEMTGESIGVCRSDEMAVFLGPIVVLMLIPTILTACMAWKTKDIDDAYSESRWIFMMIVLQIEVIFVAVPTITVLRDVSTDGKYIGFVFMLWSFPASALVFIILPKVVAHFRAIRGNDLNRVPKRGDARGSVWVSGLAANSPQLSSDSADRNSLITSRLEGGSGAHQSDKITVTAEHSSNPAEASGGRFAIAE
jgi:hypothetical protein